MSIFLHSQHYVPTERLASVIALCNQDTLRGEFTILNIKSLKTNERVGARVLALDGSPEFLESLAKTRKDHKFRLSNKRFYISGGTRLDSKSTPSSFPSLTSEQSTSILTRMLWCFSNFYDMQFRCAAAEAFAVGRIQIMHSSHACSAMI